MFKLIQSTPVAGDCTCGYQVDLGKDYTVKDFIDAILLNKDMEWGSISIYEDKMVFSLSIQYGNGKIKSGAFSNEILEQKIKKVTASGGWSRMDYIITINN